MKYFLIFCFLILTSCASSKSPYNYFAECEEESIDFTKLSSCAFKEMQADCKSNKNCRNENKRFTNIMKRLQIMVDSNEISENEAMFRYFNLMDLEDLKFKAAKNMDPMNYRYNPYNFYVRGMSSCYFSRNGICY
tara:strand:- start:85 stop:489 length:405 start_codon:yes stop_codon:yes gene_type:complete